MVIMLSRQADDDEQMHSELMGVGGAVRAYDATPINP